MQTSDRKVAIISGGTRGLGAAYAEELLKLGWRVCVFARRDSDFVQRASQTPEWQDRFIAQRVDIRDHAATQQLVHSVNEYWGPVDLLVNNAGISKPMLLMLETDEHIDEHLETNLRGALRMSRNVVQGMINRRRGKIINITSVVGLRGYSGLAAYSATKAGIDALTRSLARELGPVGITVNAIAPGYIPTEMTKDMSLNTLKWNLEHTPMGRLGTIADYIGPFLFLVSDASNFVSGQTLVVDGGMTA